MRVYVDQPDQGKPTEFAYHADDDNGDEYVRVHANGVNIYNNIGEDLAIDAPDIPKLIKALEAAYDQINKEKS